MEITILLVVLGLLATAGLTYLVVSRRGDASLEPPRSSGGTAVLEREPAAAPAQTDVATTPTPAAEAPPVEAPEAAPVVEVAPARPSFRNRLAKARGTLAGYLGSILSRGVDTETWDELEEALIRADVGIDETASLLGAVRTRVEADGITESAKLLEVVKDELRERLGGHDRTLHLMEGGPTMWLFVGVNGVGKTTTIGKLGKREVDAGHTVVMAAGDTFRAAAAEQLGLWAERSGAHLVRGAEGADPASVVFDAAESAAARGFDLVLADTAGRLHTKSNLMDELRKVRRVADKSPATVAEVLLVLDATTGQNGLTQAREFTDAVDLTGVVLTKLDGSAKGGIVLAIQRDLGIPVKLVGLGEGVEDLVEFDVDEFVEALFGAELQGAAGAQGAGNG
jgi:fused signal recognition particle receptor